MEKGIKAGAEDIAAPRRLNGRTSLYVHGYNRFIGFGVSRSGRVQDVTRRMKAVSRHIIWIVCGVLRDIRVVYDRKEAQGVIN